MVYPFQEVVLYIFYSTLYLSFILATAYSGCNRGTSIMFQESSILMLYYRFKKAWRDYSGFKIIQLNDGRNTAEELKGQDMASDKCLYRLIKYNDRARIATVAQYHAEHPGPNHLAIFPEPAKVSKIYLGFLAGITDDRNEHLSTFKIPYIFYYRGIGYLNTFFISKILMD